MSEKDLSGGRSGAFRDPSTKCSWCGGFVTMHHPDDGDKDEELVMLNNLVIELNRRLVMKDQEIIEWIGRYRAMGSMVDDQAARANEAEGTT